MRKPILLSIWLWQWGAFVERADGQHGRCLDSGGINPDDIFAGLGPPAEICPNNPEVRGFPTYIDLLCYVEQEPNLTSYVHTIVYL